LRWNRPAAGLTNICAPENLSQINRLPFYCLEDKEKAERFFGKNVKKRLHFTEASIHYYQIIILTVKEE
jgi:hypothetical protein